MNLQNATIHLIEKKRNQKRSILRLRDSELTMNEVLERFMGDVVEKYEAKTGKTFGSFNDDDINYPFSSLLDQYYTERGIDFNGFTHLAMQTLKARIDKENLATGGYVLFAQYAQDVDNYLLTIMLNDTLGRQITNNLEIKEAPHLDMSKLHLGGRVSLTRWKDGTDEKYISFIKGKIQGVSQYFSDFLGCAEYIDVKEETKSLVTVVNAYCNQHDFSTEETINFKKKVHSFCIDKIKEGRSLSLEGLSHYLNEEAPEDFLTFANSDDYKLTNEFQPDRSILRRLVLYSGRGKGLQIQFDAELLNKSVHYDKVKDILTIQELPEDLKRELLENA